VIQVLISLCTTFGKTVAFDWRYGYRTASVIEGFEMAFYTPHTMMFEPRMSEDRSLVMEFLSRSKMTATDEEWKAYVQLLHEDPAFYKKEVNQLQLSDEESDTLKYMEHLLKAHQKGRSHQAMKEILRSLLYSTCPIDAYLWIGRWLAVGEDEQYEFFRKAAGMAELASREYKLHQHLDTLWSDVCYRPFLRGRAVFQDRLLSFKLTQKELNPALKGMLDLVKLDKLDAMGLRFLLMQYYLLNKKYAEMEKLFQDYPADELNPLFLYPLAMMRFHTLGGKHEKALETLQKAIHSNPFYLYYFFTDELKVIPVYPESIYLPGSPEEASYMLSISLSLWCQRNPALEDWMLKHFDDHLKTINAPFRGGSAIA
jgi:tetratricopeptide (TPR) repeat protein